MRIVCDPTCPGAVLHGEGVIYAPNASRCTCGAVGFRSKLEGLVAAWRKNVTDNIDAGNEPGWGSIDACMLRCAFELEQLLSLLRVVEPN